MIDRLHAYVGGRLNTPDGVFVIGESGFPKQGTTSVGVARQYCGTLGKATAAQRAREKERTWRTRYHWRAGIEGRISSLRRDYGLSRCADHGPDGIERRVGWGVIGSNLRHIGQAPAA